MPVKTKLLFLFFLFLFIFSNAQKKYVMGNVKNEMHYNVSGTYIFNPRTEDLVTTDISGNFIISAISTDELRIVKNGYERISLKISETDFTKPLEIVIVKLPFDIPEVELSFHPTGDLKKDVKNVGDRKAVKKLKDDMDDYLLSNSTPEILAPQHGEFVQPVGPGFSVGNPSSKWDDVDFMKFLVENIDKEFFTKDLKLQDSEIQNFIYYIFKNFERKKILFYGVCSPADLSRFMTEAYIKIEAYRKNIPNNPPKKKKRR